MVKALINKNVLPVFRLDCCDVVWRIVLIIIIRKFIYIEFFFCKTTIVFKIDKM